MRSLLAGCVLAAALFLIGCPTGSNTPIEKVALRTAAGAKGFLDSVKQHHPECPGASSTVCTDLQKATAAKDLLIDATEQYCAGPGFETGGPCNPPTDPAAKDQAAAKLRAAIDGYKQTETDLKGVLK
jgi:hypothetical protein